MFSHVTNVTLYMRFIYYQKIRKKRDKYWLDTFARDSGKQLFKGARPKISWQCRTSEILNVTLLASVMLLAFRILYQDFMTVENRKPLPWRFFLFAFCESWQANSCVDLNHSIFIFYPAESMKRVCFPFQHLWKHKSRCLKNEETKVNS